MVELWNGVFLCSAFLVCCFEAEKVDCQIYLTENIGTKMFGGFCVWKFGGTSLSGIYSNIKNKKIFIKSIQN